MQFADFRTSPRGERLKRAIAPFALLAVALAIFGLAWFYLARPSSVAVIESSAQAWLWVPQAQQEQFIEDLRSYAGSRDLIVRPVDSEAQHWRETGVTLLTRSRNEISVVATASPDKFNAAIILLHPESTWPEQWHDFRGHLREHYRWEDVP
jgi:hypothetical protein